MNLRPFQILLCAAAGFAGWWSADWQEGGDVTRHSSRPRVLGPALPPNEGATALRPPPAGSRGLARLPGLVAALANDSLSTAEKKIATWPPGLARDFAAALVREREPAAKDPSAPTEERMGPPYNRFSELAAAMKEGEIMADAGLHPTLEDWVFLDPAAATAAVLKMAPDAQSRSAAVDTTAESLAKTDPAVALEFFFKSGESKLGSGTASAWVKLVTAKTPGTDGLEAPLPFLNRLTLAQQDSLFNEVAGLMGNRDVSYPLPDRDMERLARGVLQPGAATPGLEAFFEELTEFPGAAEEVREFITSGDTASPAHQKALEILCAQQAEESTAHGLGAFLSSLDALPGTASREAVQDRAAPSVVSDLADSGHLPDALRLLSLTHDPDARRAALKAVLPAWMNADPTAARAAFDAAPLTALERERWQQQPAFLLHPKR